MSDVETCRECGRLFGFLPRGICVDCQDLREQRFQAVKDYLRENAGASILQTATETGEIRSPASSKAGACLSSSGSKSTEAARPATSWTLRTPFSAL